MIRHASTGAQVDDLLRLVMEEPRPALGRPWVMFNLVTSLDGRLAVEGSSTGLSDDDDRELFHALRTVPDVILVGAGTVRAEDYRPVTLDGRQRAVRQALGLAPAPTLAIVSGRLSIDPAARVFSDPEHRPLVITGPNPDIGKIGALEAVAGVRVLDEMDARSIVGALSPAGIILCEGGPTLNGRLFAAGLVDEVNLTISPLLVGGEGPGRPDADEIRPALEMAIDRVLRGDRSMFLRLLKKGG